MWLGLSILSLIQVRKSNTGIFIDRILGQYVFVLVPEEECRAGEDSQKANDGRFEWYKAIKSGGSYLLTYIALFFYLHSII